MTFFSKDFYKVSIENFKEAAKEVFNNRIAAKDFEEESPFEREFLGDEQC